jgi:hypothetical protein
VKLGYLSRKWAQLGLLAALLVAFAPTLALASMDAAQFRASLGVDCSARVVTAGASAGPVADLSPADASDTTTSSHCQADCGYCFWNAPAALPPDHVPHLAVSPRALPHALCRQSAAHAHTVFLHDAAPRGPPLSC